MINIYNIKEVVMSSVVTGAFEAVKIANKVTGAVEGPAEGKLEGRSFRHWSFYLLVTGSLVGVVAAVAGGVFNFPYLIAGGIILFVTNTVAAYYVKKFYPLKELEGYVEVMTAKINEMSQHITSLNKINKELDGTADRLDANLVEDKKVWEHGYDGVKKEADEIQRLTNKLEVTTKKLMKIEEMYKNLQNALNDFSNGVSDLAQNRNDINSKVSELADHVKGAEEVLGMINNENDEFDENNALYDQLNKANLNFLEQLHEELRKFMELHGETKGLTEVLEKQSVTLVKVSDQIAESLKAIEAIEKEEEKDRKEHDKYLKKAKKATKALESVALEISKLKEA